FLSLGLFSGSVLLLAASAVLITRNVSLDGVVQMGVLYLLFWLAVLSLTYCITWLLSPSKTAPASAESPTVE
ncbi:MAG: hypothetical protein IJX14_08845, partial [Clostridia bacterium]|nr:hypothetical protein [Clostridia bacterium]